MKIALPVWVLVLLILTIVALIVIIWSIKRRKRPHLALEDSGGNDDLMPSISGITQGTIVDGNHIELLQNGALWDRMFEDMSNAKETITFETFLSKCGTLTGRLTDTLIKKKNEGVQVRMLLDGSGGRKFG